MVLAGCPDRPGGREAAAPTGAADELLPPEELAGGALRAVWIREVGDGTDWHAATGNVVLMGYDSRDGGGVRVLHEGRPNYNKPLLSPDGGAVVYTDLSDRSGGIMRLDWMGDDPVRLGPGLALDVWEDPAGEVWVYAGDGPMDERGNVSRVSRFPLERPGERELVWDHPVARDNFQLGRSGEYAGGLFPAAPKGGLVNLDTLEFDVYAGGCWASLSPHERRLVWVFDGRHRNLMFFAADRNILPEGAADRWIVNITGAPGIDGARTYYPRWSNHSRFFGVSGPMPHGNYEQAEIYVGRFAEDHRSVEAWTRLTDDDRPDLFPDVLVFPEGGSGGSEKSPPGGGDGSPPPESFRATGVLLEKTRTPRPADVLPYESALAVYRYRIDEMPETGGEGEILVAHWVIRDERVLRGFRREIGREYPLVLEPYEGNPKFEGERVVSDLAEGGETLYVDESSLP
ncbi:MAG: hypothetical protein ACLFSZ_00200 [Puniceicoccaceae bacterium]